jgi:hypothetical protein
MKRPPRSTSRADLAAAANTVTPKRILQGEDIQALDELLKVHSTQLVKLAGIHMEGRAMNERLAHLQCEESLVRKGLDEVEQQIANIKSLITRIPGPK